MTKQDGAFIALNTTEAEQIVHELGRALDSDREWGEKFLGMLVCRTKPKAHDLNVDSHKKTVFGRWYYGQVNSKLRDHPDFAAVGKNSEQMHDLAYELACAIRDDIAIQPRQYKAFTKSADRFRRSVRKMLSEAWDFLRHADPLTGTLMRGAMNVHLEGEQERSRRSQQASCIAMMDLDHFKSVNDTYGHQAGDKVLQMVADYLLENLRRYDRVFRYGGEEFLILLPNTLAENSKNVLDRIREKISQQQIKLDDGRVLQVSASFGVAVLQVDKSPKDSIELADQALYKAKKTGRNRVEVWQPENDSSSATL